MFCFFFFFQAEDGIRDIGVTGVQTCALPISKHHSNSADGGGMEMKVLFVSFLVGLGVGALYGLIRVKSPAPPIVALLGLLGMVLGEQLGTWIQTKKVDLPRAAAVCLVGESYNSAASIRSALAVSAPEVVERIK